MGWFLFMVSTFFALHYESVYKFHKERHLYWYEDSKTWKKQYFDLVDKLSEKTK